MTLDWTEFYPVCSMVHAHQMWGFPQQFLKNLDEISDQGHSHRRRRIR